MKNGNKSKQLYKIILIAIFSALACAATFVQIPLPTGDMVHLGNFVCILAALLCGGLIGGISGSLGMGIYDLIMYSAYPSTIVRTFIMKFIMGLVAGIIFKLVIRRKLKTTMVLYFLSASFLCVMIWSITILANGGNFSAIVGEQSGSKPVSLMIPIASGILCLMLFSSALMSSRLRRLQRVVLFSVSLAVFVNIIGEFILRIPLTMLIDNAGFEYALIKSITSIPSTLLTGMITLVLITFIFESLYKSVRSINYLNNDLIDELVEKKAENN